MKDKEYRLDRTKFKMQTFEEADFQYNFWKDKTREERLKAANYLISVAWGFDLNDPPQLDKSRFSMRKHHST